LLASGSALAPQEAAIDRNADFARLIGHIHRRNSDAFRDLYRQTVDDLRGRARQILRNPADAEEVLNDVYMQVWMSPCRYEPARGSVMSWLHAMCLSRAIDRYRMNRRREFMQCGSIDALASECTASDEPQLSARELAAAQEALDTLPPLRRRLLAIVFFGGLTHEEAAQELRIPLGTVKSHLRRTLRELRCILDQSEAPALASRPPL